MALPLCAQPPLHSSATAPELIAISATEDALWLSYSSTANESLLFLRGRGGSFDLGRTMTGRVVQLAGLMRGALAVFDTGAMYSFAPDATQATTEAALPHNEMPLSLLARGNQL